VRTGPYTAVRLVEQRSGEPKHCRAFAAPRRRARFGPCQEVIGTSSLLSSRQARSFWIFGRMSFTRFRLSSPLHSIPVGNGNRSGLRGCHGFRSARAVSPLSSECPASQTDAACRVGGGAPKRWPPSAAQTGHAVFQHPAFTKMRH
jgi:hypothetical protein